MNLGRGGREGKEGCREGGRGEREGRRERKGREKRERREGAREREGIHERMQANCLQG